MEIKEETGVWKELSRMLLLERRTPRLQEEKKRKDRSKHLMVWMLD